MSKPRIQKQLAPRAQSSPRTRLRMGFLACFANFARPFELRDRRRSPRCRWSRQSPASKRHCCSPFLRRFPELRCGFVRRIERPNFDPLVAANNSITLQGSARWFVRILALKEMAPVRKTPWGTTEAASWSFQTIEKPGLRLWQLFDHQVCHGSGAFRVELRVVAFLVCKAGACVAPEVFNEASARCVQIDDRSFPFRRAFLHGIGIPAKLILKLSSLAKGPPHHGSHQNGGRPDGARVVDIAGGGGITEAEFLKNPKNPNGRPLSAEAPPGCCRGWTA